MRRRHVRTGLERTEREAMRIRARSKSLHRKEEERREAERQRRLREAGEHWRRLALERGLVEEDEDVADPDVPEEARVAGDQKWRKRPRRLNGDKSLRDLERAASADPSDKEAGDIYVRAYVRMRAPDIDWKTVSFFYHHAGWSTPPGHVESALGLARAEEEAKRRRWHVRWMNDEDGWSIRREHLQETGEKADEVEVAILYDRNNNDLAALGGIIDASTEFKRVVEAELAIEALANLPDEEPRVRSNSDRRLRDLERRWRQSDRDEDFKAFTDALIQAGQAKFMSWDKVWTLLDDTGRNDRRELSVDDEAFEWSMGSVERSEVSDAVRDFNETHGVRLNLEQRDAIRNLIESAWADAFRESLIAELKTAVDMCVELAESVADSEDISGISDQRDLVHPTESHPAIVRTWIGHNDEGDSGVWVQFGDPFIRGYVLAAYAMGGYYDEGRTEFDADDLIKVAKWWAEAAGMRKPLVREIDPSRSFDSPSDEDFMAAVKDADKHLAPRGEDDEGEDDDEDEDD